MGVKMTNGQTRTRKYEESAIHSKRLALKMDELVNGASSLAKYIHESFKELQSDFQLGHINSGDYRQFLTGFKSYFDTMDLFGNSYHHPDLHAEEIIKAMKEETIPLDIKSAFPSQGRK